MSRMLFRSLPSTSSTMRRTICTAQMSHVCNSVEAACAAQHTQKIAFRQGPEHWVADAPQPSTPPRPRPTCGWQHDWRRPVKAAKARPTALLVWRTRLACKKGAHSRIGRPVFETVQCVASVQGPAKSDAQTQAQASSRPTHVLPHALLLLHLVGCGAGEGAWSNIQGSTVAPRRYRHSCCPTRHVPPACCLPTLHPPASQKARLLCS